MPRLVCILFFFTISYQGYHLYYGEQGIKHQKELIIQIKYQEQVNQRLERRNQALLTQVNDLRQGDDAIEEHVRTDLQYIKDSEIFYQIVKQ